MNTLKHDLLDWAAGIFCLSVGTMMLIVPHQFNTPSYKVLSASLSIWGMLFTLAGCSLLAVAILKPDRLLVIASHLFVGMLLLLLAVGFAQVSALSGITHYTVLGLGIMFAPFVARSNLEAKRISDLFGIVMGIAAIVTGAGIFFFPGQYNPSIIASVHDLISVMGIAFLAVGLFALVVILRSSTNSPIYKIAHIALGLVYFAWFIWLAIPIHALTGYPYYGGLGLLLMLAPWLQDRVHNLQKDSLRVRFGLVSAALTVVPLLLLAVLFTEQQRQAAIDRTLNYQQNFAAAQSQYIASLLSLYRSASVSFAAQPGLMEMSQTDQENLARSFKEAYPETQVFALRDASNNLLVRSDGIKQVNPPLAQSVFEQVRATNQPVMTFVFGTVYKRFMIVFASPVHDHNGNFNGMTILAVETSRLSALLSQVSADSEDLVYVVDEMGHAIIHPDESLVQDSVDLSQTPPVASLLAGNASSGAIAYKPAGNGEMLAGYARVPGAGWGIIVEQAAERSLTGMQAGRELTLLALILVCGVALVISTLLSKSLTDPLWNVAHAMNQLTVTDAQPTLLTSGIAEIRLLIQAFNDLCSRLANRTQERDQADQRLLFLAEATNALNKSLDVDETLRAIAKLAVPRIGDWCTIDVVDENNVLQQVAVVHTEPEAEALVTAWRAEELQKPHDVDLARDVLRTGEPILIPEIPANMIEAVATGDDATFKLLKALNLLSALCVPLSVRGERVGIIFLNTSRESGRKLTQDDLVLLSELARRASTAIDNAKLYAEAQRAIQLRDEFLSVAAHELKTPVTSMRGFAQATLRQFSKGEAVDRSRVETALKRIDEQSEKLGRLITQLLDVSRIMGGKLVLEPKEVDLTALVKTIAANAQLNTERHTIRISDSAECKASVDPLRFEQVMINLVDNAIKYSPDGGPIMIDIITQPTGTIRVAVTDHGLGIPAAARDQVFNRFFQAHRDGHYGGMGLGLYISRQIVELHGGSLHAEFPAEGGTRFVISLPC